MKHPGWMLGIVLWGVLTAFLLRYSWHAHQREMQVIQFALHSQMGCDSTTQKAVSQAISAAVAETAEQHNREIQRLLSPIPEFRRGKPK